MGAVSIRPANEQDLQTLCDMYYEFHEYHVRGVATHLRSLGERDGWDRSRFREGLDRIFASDDAQLLLAEICGEPVGLAEVYVRQDEDGPCVVAHRYAELQSLLVLEPFRGRGVGEQLVAATRDWARQRGATEMRLKVWEFNEDARRFYERLGFRTLKRGMLSEL